MTKGCRRFRFLSVAAASLSIGLAATLPASAQALGDAVGTVRAFAGLSFERPVAMIQAPGSDADWYVAEQAGRIFTFADDPGAARADLVLDLRAGVDSGPNEAGLLGMALHPDFAANRQVFLSYTRPGTGRGVALISVISRFTADADGRRLDPDSEQIVLTLEQPFGNHNGGHIAFGPDGFLYAGFGDGGAGGDPRNNGQNTGTLLGTLLRVDVDGPGAYEIPPDNPFADGVGGRPEIHAYGLRNPWRWSFDRQTGELWLADVGQNRWEEVDRIVSGGNYGWNAREGAHGFDGSTRAAGPLIEPVAEYSHQQGCSVTGGFVYRGRAIADLQGFFVYGDFCSGLVWGVRRTTNSGTEVQRLMQTDLRIAAFAEGNDGELYILDHGRGRIFQLVAR